MAVSSMLSLAKTFRSQLPMSHVQASEQLGLTEPRAIGTGSRLAEWLVDPVSHGPVAPGKASLALAHSAVCLQLFAPLCARILLYGALPRLNPTTVGFDDHHWFWHTGSPDADQPDIELKKLVSEVTERFLELRLPRSILYSNAAVALALPWTRLGLALENPAPLRPYAEQWLLAFGEPYLEGVIWRQFDWPDRRLLLPHRQGCCLRFMVADGELCGTCSRHSADELRCRLRTWLDDTASGEVTQQEKAKSSS